MKIVMSSGHGKYVRGASGYIDEVDEARLVVEAAAVTLRNLGVETTTYHDDVSKSQNENLNRIVNFHNSKSRDYDISVHFNASKTTDKPMGTEVFYASDAGLEKAKPVVNGIASVGFINRGPKHNSGLKFLNSTEKPAILVEVCFVDSRADTDRYKRRFNSVCEQIALGIAGEVKPPVGPEVLFSARGRCSHFGGPKDMGVSPSEGLAFIFEINQAPELFLPVQPPGTTGLARRLDPRVYYVACRWDYEMTSKEALRVGTALVRAKGREFRAAPADWGPNENTGRVADLSPGLMEALGLVTDDEVEVIYPAPEAQV